jgi:hypothetical protein
LRAEKPAGESDRELLGVQLYERRREPFRKGKPVLAGIGFPIYKLVSQPASQSAKEKGEWVCHWLLRLRLAA